MNLARHPLAFASAALVIMACATPLRAAEPVTPTTSAEPTSNLAHGQALRVVRDRDTGKLRAPTPEEMPDLLAAERAERKARGLPEPTSTPTVIRYHASGMRSAVLGPEHLVTIKAQRDASGKLVITHGNPAQEHSAAPSQRPTE